MLLLLLLLLLFVIIISIIIILLLLLLLVLLSITSSILLSEILSIDLENFPPMRRNSRRKGICVLIWGKIGSFEIVYIVLTLKCLVVTKRSHILKQTCSWKLRVCLIICDLFVTTRHLRFNWISIFPYQNENHIR